MAAPRIAATISSTEPESLQVTLPPASTKRSVHLTGECWISSQRRRSWTPAHPAGRPACQTAHTGGSSSMPSSIRAVVGGGGGGQPAPGAVVLRPPLRPLAGRIRGSPSRTGSDHRRASSGFVRIHRPEERASDLIVAAKKPVRHGNDLATTGATRSSEHHRRTE